MNTQLFDMCKDYLHKPTISRATQITEENFEEIGMLLFHNNIVYQLDNPARSMSANWYQILHAPGTHEREASILGDYVVYIESDDTWKLCKKDYFESIYVQVASASEAKRELSQPSGANSIKIPIAKGQLTMFIGETGSISGAAFSPLDWFTLLLRGFSKDPGLEGQFSCKNGVKMQILTGWGEHGVEHAIANKIDQEGKLNVAKAINKNGKQFEPKVFIPYLHYGSGMRYFRNVPREIIMQYIKKQGGVEA